MPKNKNAMTRYQILDNLLSNKYHNYSIEDLTERVNKALAEINPDDEGVGRRTIEKDLRYLELESPFMVELERYTVTSYDEDTRRERRKHCLRYADPSYSIFRKALSDDERAMLREALSLLGQFDGLPNLEGLERLRRELHVADDEAQIISFTKNPVEHTSLLGELFTAIAHRQVVALHYHKFQHEDDVKTIAVFPYLLKEYNRRWYLVCRPEGGSKLLFFGLDRIDRVEKLPSHTYKPYEGDVHEIFDDIVGVTWMEKEPLQKIYFWVSASTMDYVRTKPLHDSQVSLKGATVETWQQSYPNLPEGAFFRIECKCNYELIRELCAFGKELLVLEPRAVQERVWERIHDQEGAYRKLRT